MKLLLTMAVVYMVADITLAFQHMPLETDFMVLQAAKMVWTFAALFFINYEV